MNSVKHSATFRINQPAEVLFPLFSAEGEKLWVPGWDYVSVTGSTELHEDYVFLTKSHDHAGTDAIWIVKRHEPDNFFVQFYRVEPEEKVGVVSVRCIPIEKQLTDIEVTYQYTALGKKGEEFIEVFTATHYREFIGQWKRLLENYFGS
jgi:hypothetical protein